MKTRLNMLLMLSIMTFGGYIAYTGAQPTTVIANPPPIYRFTDVPKEKSVINLNLFDETLTVEGTADVEVNIQKEVKEPEVRTITKWKEKIVERIDTVKTDYRTYPGDIVPFVRNNRIPIPEVPNLNEINIR